MFVVVTCLELRCLTSSLCEHISMLDMVLAFECSVVDLFNGILLGERKVKSSVCVVILGTKFENLCNFLTATTRSC